MPPLSFPDYELIDTGQFEKLERFGKYILARPEPQALWDKALSQYEWDKMAHACFKRIGKSDEIENSERGEWVKTQQMPDQWLTTYKYKEMEIKLRMGMTAFKHVGIFPEQVDNWNFIYDTIRSMPIKPCKVLNLFAYTGGASLAAKAAGADVTHVDSVKQVITWSRENMEASGLTDIRWVVEDAVKYVQREVKRGNQYNGIILDPPAYGRGPNGEKWLLDRSLNELLKMCKQLLSPESNFIVLNLYSMGYSPCIAHNLLHNLFNDATIESGELGFSDHAGRKLPLGIFARFSKNKFL